MELHSRRRALLLAGGTAALIAEPSAFAASGIRAVVFDGFPIFDPRSITALVRHLVPEKGDELAKFWIDKLFARTWLVTAASQYQDFAALADSTLEFAAASLRVDVTATTRAQVIDGYSHLDVWPDVKAALSSLRAAGIRLAFASNLTETMLNASMRHAGIAHFFEAALSTDRVRQFKPAPAAYRMAMDVLDLRKEDIGFAAFGGWDAAGASWFGYRTAWINRLGAPDEELGIRPAIVTRGIEGAVALAGVNKPI